MIKVFKTIFDIFIVCILFAFMIVFLLVFSVVTILDFIFHTAKRLMMSFAKGFVEEVTKKMVKTAKSAGRFVKYQTKDKTIH